MTVSWAWPWKLLVAATGLLACAMTLAAVVVFHGTAGQPPGNASAFGPAGDARPDASTNPPDPVDIAPPDGANNDANDFAATTPPPTVHPPRESAPLRNAIDAALDGRQSRVAVVAWRLSDGLAAWVGEDEVFYAASLFKLAVLYAVELRLSEGTLEPGQPVTIMPEDAAEDLGTYDRLPISADGTIILADALQAMITYSDNTTAVALHHLVGGSDIDDAVRAVGLRDTSVNTTDLPTTAADMARLMAALVSGAGVTAAEQERVVRLLEQQETRGGIPAGLPEGVRVGNKTGTWAGATHDVAFVDAPHGRYVLAVLTDGDWDWAVIRDLSTSVYTIMSSVPEGADAP